MFQKTNGQAEIDQKRCYIVDGGNERSTGYGRIDIDFFK